MAYVEESTGSRVGLDATMIAGEWRRLRRAATAVAVFTSPLFFVVLYDRVKLPLGWALLALQGPRAFDVLASAGTEGAPLSALRSFHFRDATVAGVRCRPSRTGYTGEDGFEIYVPSDENTSAMVFSRPMMSDTQPKNGRARPLQMLSMTSAALNVVAVKNRMVTSRSASLKSAAMGAICAVAIRPDAETNTNMRYRSQNTGALSMSGGG